MSEIWKPHVTVAAIAEEHGKLLLVEELINGQLVLNQPAGHLDDGESIIDAVIRETLEETAYEFVPEHLIGVYRWCPCDKDRTYIRFAFSGKIGKHFPNQPLDDGITQALWLSPEEITAQQQRWRTTMVGEVFDHYLSGNRYPLEILNEVSFD